MDGAAPMIHWPGDLGGWPAFSLAEWGLVGGLQQGPPQDKVGGPCLSALRQALSSFRGSARPARGPGWPETQPRLGLCLCFMWWGVGVLLGVPAPAQGMREEEAGRKGCHTHNENHVLTGHSPGPSRSAGRLGQGLPLPALVSSSFLVGMGVEGRQKAGEVSRSTWYL